MSLGEKVDTGEVVVLSIPTLRNGPLVRANRIDADRVTDLVPVLEEVPPITVAWPSMEVIDGAHRLAAATRVKAAGIRAVLVGITNELDKYLAALRANAKHGKPYTLSERKQQAVKLIKSSDLSDVLIATEVGLSPSTVADLRPSRPTSRKPEVGHPAEKRTGGDGKRRPADPAAQRQAVDEALEQNPDASDREVARNTGASPTTVGSRRKQREGLSLVPPVVPDAAPSADDFLKTIPKRWAKEEACQRSKAGQAFAALMDKAVSVKPRSGEVRVWEDGFAPHVSACPAELRDAALFVARQQAKCWGDFAAAIEAGSRIEGVQ